jgi:hypothetical protein
LWVTTQEAMRTRLLWSSGRKGEGKTNFINIGNYFLLHYPSHCLSLKKTSLYYPKKSVFLPLLRKKLILSADFTNKISKALFVTWKFALMLLF